MIRKNFFSTGAQKLLLYKEEINKWKSGESLIPITLEIQPSEICNHLCPQCQGKIALTKKEARIRSRNGSLLDFSLLESVWKNPPKGIVISGNTGDPLLHPEIDWLLEKANIEGIPSVLITNGQAITTCIAEKMINNCRGVRISIDSFDKESFHQSHGGSSDQWEELINNINLLVKIKKSNIKSNCQIGIGFLTNSFTKKWMKSATIFAKKNGVDYIQFRPFHYDNTNVMSELKQCENEENSSFKVLSSYQKYSRLGDIQNKSFLNCQAAWFYTVLDARGDFYICCHNVGNAEARLGTLKDSTWEEYCKSELRRKIIGCFSTGVCIPNCRLQTQNEMLKKIRNKKFVTPNSINKQILYHSMFL